MTPRLSGSAVDVVAEHDVARLPPVRVGGAAVEQAPELVDAAVDVANRKGQSRHGGSSELAPEGLRCRPRRTWHRRKSTTAAWQPQNRPGSRAKKPHAALLRSGTARKIAELGPRSGS